MGGGRITPRATGLHEGPARLSAPDRLDRPFADPLVGRIFPPLPTGVHWGLERTLGALEALGDPHLSYPTIHVGGTNGKGSVAATLAAVLNETGLKTGCYTSPHLCSFRERIVVGGEALSEQTLIERADEIRDVVARFGLTFFEAATVLAFHAFARAGIDLMVAEVGLGGRLDATNVVRPLVSAVTNVAFDHADYLGDTVAEIAMEKAGIMKEGVPFVTMERDEDTLESFRRVAGERGVPFRSVDAEATLDDIEVAVDHTAFALRTRSWGAIRVRTPLVGRHQAANTALAVGILEELPEQLRPPREALVAGIQSVVHPGRDQVEVIDGTTWLFDIAHNTAGIQSLVDTLDRIELPRPLTVLVGVLGDKDWKGMLPPLLARAGHAVLTQPPSAPPERRWDAYAAAEAVSHVCPIDVEEDFVKALATVRSEVGAGSVVVTGSVHTVGSALTLLGLEPLTRSGRL